MFKRIICLIFACTLLIGCEKEVPVPNEDVGNSTARIANAWRLGENIGKLPENTPFIEVTNTDFLECMPDAPFYISGFGAVAMDDLYAEDLSLVLNSAFNGNFNIVGIEWETSSNLSGTGESLTVTHLAENEPVNVVCNVYATDGNYVYLTTMEFEIYIDDTSNSNASSGGAADGQASWWQGVSLYLSSDLTADVFCGGGELAIAIIVPFKPDD